VAGAVGALVQADAVVEDATGRLDRAGGDGREASDAAVLRRVAEQRERRRTTDRTRVELVRSYADTRDCRRRVLLELLGEEHPQPCGRCDSCDEGRSTVVEGSGYRVGQLVRHREFGEGVVQVVEVDRITVLFDTHGFTALALGVLEGDEGLLAAA
jgi:ATP-dependent DNA helicase RecQ